MGKKSYPFEIMNDCTCKGRNTNCFKCHGKGLINDNTSIFGIKKEKKIIKGADKKRGKKKNKQAKKK